MLKKIIFLASIVFSILLFISFTYASNLGNELKNSMDKTGNTLENAMNSTKEAGRDVANSVGNVTGDIMSGTESMMNGLGNMLMRNDTNTEDMPYENNVSNNYTASRTATYGSNSQNSSMWIWVILGIIGLLIIGLTWYYMSDNQKQHHE